MHRQLAARRLQAETLAQQAHQRSIEVVVQQAWAPPGIQGDQFDQHRTLVHPAAPLQEIHRRAVLQPHPLGQPGAGCTPLGVQRLGTRLASLGADVFHEAGGTGRVVADPRRRDEPAAAVLAIDQAFGFQLLQGFAKGDAGTQEALGQLPLGGKFHLQHTLGDIMTASLIQTGRL